MSHDDAVRVAAFLAGIAAVWVTTGLGVAAAVVVGRARRRVTR